MSIFGKIKDAIFGRKAEARPQPGPTGGQTGGAPGTARPAPAPTMEQVDVEQVLVGMQKEKGNPDLNWRTSIVDLMKLLGIFKPRQPQGARDRAWVHRRQRRQRRDEYLAAQSGDEGIGQERRQGAFETDRLDHRRIFTRPDQ